MSVMLEGENIYIKPHGKDIISSSTNTSCQHEYLRKSCRMQERGVIRVLNCLKMFKGKEDV